MAKEKKIVRLVPETVIDDPAFNSRKAPVSDEDVLRMAESISEFGQKQPGLHRIVDGKTYVVAGRTRLAAICLLNANRAENEEALFFESVEIKADDTTALTAAVIENAIRSSMDPVDESDAMARLLAQNKTQAEIARIFGVDEATVTQRLKIQKLSKRVQKMIQLGDLNPEVVSVLTLTDDKDLQEKIVADAIESRKKLEEAAAAAYAANEAAAQEAAAAADTPAPEADKGKGKGKKEAASAPPAKKKAGKKTSAKATKEDVAQAAKKAGLKVKAARSRSTLIKFLESMPKKEVGEKGVSLAGRILEYLDGERDEAGLMKSFRIATGFEVPKS